MWILVGYFIFSLTMGYFVGASNSPVVGVFITAIIGLAGTIFSSNIINQNNNEFDKGVFIGKALILISVGLFIGEPSGELYRNGLPHSNEKKMIWAESAHELSSTSEALDWIVLNEKLINMGYSEPDIKKLYQKRLEEIKEIKNKNAQSSDKYLVSEVYDTSNPLNEIIKLQNSNITKKGSRGPASIK